MNASVVLLTRVARATVGIHSNVPATHVSSSMGLGTDRRGTGAVVSADGLIVTVNYVLMGAESVIVTLSDGQQHEAAVIARDYRSGLGLVKIDATNLTYLPIAPLDECQVGQDVFIVSSVGGDGRCADSGVITYLGPFDAVWEFILDRCVCITSSSLNIGLSGGPICDSKGRLVAVSYLNFTDIGRAILGIPAEYFSSVRDELLHHGKRTSSPVSAWLGLLTYTVRQHVVVAGVMPGSPGEKAGLVQGDLVLGIDGSEVNERRMLYEAIGRHRPGDSVRLRILRNNQAREIELQAISMEDFMS